MSVCECVCECVCVCMCVWVLNVLPYPRIIIWKSSQCRSRQSAMHFQFHRTNETSALGTSVCCAVLFECRRTHLVDFS